MTLFPPETFADVIQTALKATNITAKEASIKLGYVNPCQLDENIRRKHGFRKQSAQNFIEKICVPANYDIGYTTSGLTLLSHKEQVMSKANDAGKVIISNLLDLQIGTAELAEGLNKSERLIVSVINGNYTPQNSEKLKKEINAFFFNKDPEIQPPFPEVEKPSLIDEDDEILTFHISRKGLAELNQAIEKITTFLHNEDFQ